MIRIAGVLKGNRPAEVDCILAHFGGEGQVPILNCHGGEPIGWIRTLMADDLDVWFIGHIADQGVEHRLRGTAVAISMELRKLGVPVDPDASNTVYGAAAQAPYYRGRVDMGYTLQGLAVLREGEPAGRPGSTMWAVAW